MPKKKYFELKRDGFEICNYRIKKIDLDQILLMIKNYELKAKNKIIFTNDSSHFHNFYLYSHKLKKLFFDKIIKELYKKYFKRNYCLRNVVLTNLQKKIKKIIKLDKKTSIGSGWHRDSPQFYDMFKKSRCLTAGITYQFIIALDDTNAENSTKLLVGSHKYQPSCHRPNKMNKKTIEKKFKKIDLVLKKGQVAIIDDHLFHKTGKANINNRKIIFINFSPWYVKPYFDYNKTVKESDSPFIKYIMHNNSIPPDALKKLQLTNKSLDF